MFVKRGLEVNLFLISVLFIAMLPVLVVAQTGQECSVNADSICGSSTVFNVGYGAVELCGVCHKCGVADGVCPEDYSDGRNETNASKTNMFIRVNRPAMYGNYNDEYSVAFNTGNLACDAIGGDCANVQRYSSGWQTVPGINCDTDFSNEFTIYTFRAVCVNVPRKSSCEYCQDPDCETMLSGKTFDSNTGETIEGVMVSISSLNNNVVLPPNTSEEYGNYMMRAVTGLSSITCSKADYITYSYSVSLQPGNNIFDCYMNNLTCNAQCTTQGSPGGSNFCQPSCDGQNGCTMTDDAKRLCTESHPGDVVPISTVQYYNATDGCWYNNVTTLNCCKGEINNYQQLIAGTCGDPINPPGGCEGSECDIISGGLFTADVSNILTRSYRKEINGLPVTLKIIVYKK